jgi:serine/threonine protein kinase
LARYIGNYKVIQELGSGHFGTVYLAVGEVPGTRGHPPRRRVVAIKKLKDAAPAVVELLLQEFALLDQVKHRGVVRVFEYLEDESAVVMEYIHGVSLRQMLEELESAREQAFTEAAVEIASEIADALYQAFTTPGDNGEPLQLVHRDLKPANIMLTPSGEIKVLDWGLARVDNSDFRQDDHRRIKGTMLYMAPEQAQGLEIDHRTDLFALGLILYELLEGRAVYQLPEGNDPVSEVKELIRTGNTEKACAQLETRLPSLGPIITQALQTRPQDRYRSGQDMMVELRRQLYRDRGAYLEEFCEFFFGSIHDIGEAVTLESLGVDSVPGQRSRDRVSIEERLRQSMVGEDQAQQGVQSTKGRGGSPMSNSKGPKPPPMVPSPGGSGQSPPSSERGGLKKVGQRSPQETGMLEMVPLSGVEAIESGQDPSATAFFAIPAPKSERAGGAPPGAATPGPPPPPGGVRPPPPPPRAGAGPAPPPGIPMVRGPVAPPPQGSPFQVTGSTPSAADNENRVNSTRVFAILFSVFLMVCMALFLAALLTDFGKEETASDGGESSSSASSSVRSGGSSRAEVDTGGLPGKEELKPTSTPTKTRRTNTVRSTVTKTQDSGSSTGLTLTLTGTAGQYKQVVGSCGSKSISLSISGGRVSLGSVSSGAVCVLSFKGGGPAPAKVSFNASKSSMKCTGTPVTCR